MKATDIVLKNTKMLVCTEDLPRLLLKPANSEVQFSQDIQTYSPRSRYMGTIKSDLRLTLHGLTRYF